MSDMKTARYAMDGAPDARWADIDWCSLFDHTGPGNEGAATRARIPRRESGQESESLVTQSKATKRSNEAADEPLDLRSPKLYINREISLLEYQQRLLAQACDPRHPLLERI